MSELTDNELKERIFSLVISKDFELKSQDQSNQKKPVLDKSNKNVKLRHDGELVQDLIDNGLPIHEKGLNRVLVQTIKEQLKSKESEEKTKLSSKFGIGRKLGYHNQIIFTKDFFGEANNKRVIAESKLLTNQEIGEFNRINLTENGSNNTRLDEAAQRLLRNIECFADTATLSTAQKSRELDLFMQRTQKRNQEYIMGFVDSFKNRNDVFSLKDLIPNQYHIIDVNSIKIKPPNM